MRLSQNRMQSYQCKKKFNRKNNEGASYVEYGAPFDVLADIYPAGGKIKVEMYGERLNYMMTMLCYPCDLSEGDIVSVDQQDYRIVCIKKYNEKFYTHWECDLEKS